MTRLAQNYKSVRTASSGPGVAIVYARVSTAKQEDEGTSLDSQAAACVAYAQKMGYSVARVIKESFTGAELWDRPLLSEARADIKAGKYQALVFYAIDRLSRNIAHLAIIAEETERAGAELICVTENLDNTPDGRLLQSVRGYVAEVERQKIKERTIRGKLERLKGGKIHGLGPELYGYRRDKERGVRVIYEPEARVVRQIFHLIAVESAGTLTVANKLTGEGIPSPWAAKGLGKSGWNATAIRNILRNQSYKGETVQWVRRSVKRRMEPRPENEHIRLPEGVTPAIVTPELWLTAQQRLEVSKGEAKRNKSRPYLLRGHIVCANCGSKMYPMPIGTRKGVYRYYRCSTYIRRFATPCGALGVPADSCEEWAWQEVKHYLQNPDLIEREVKRLQADGIDSQLVKDREVASRTLERQNQVVQRLAKRLRDADDELADIIERELLQAKRERDGLIQALADLEERIKRQERIVINLESLHDYCRQVGQALSSFTFEEKRLAIGALGAEITANGRCWRMDTLIPEYLEPKTISSNCSQNNYTLTLARRPPDSAAKRAGVEMWACAREAREV